MKTIAIKKMTVDQEVFQVLEMEMIMCSGAKAYRREAALASVARWCLSA